MRNKPWKKRPQRKFVQKLQIAVLLLLFALVLPMSHGVFLPGTFLFVVQIIALLLLLTLLIVIIVGSNNHIKRKRAEIEKLKKDDSRE